jgi:hypothetical protein
MRIPMRGAIDSLNAAVAGSILLFEALAQRDPTGSGGGRRAPGGATLNGPEPVPAADPAGPGEPSSGEPSSGEPSSGEPSPEEPPSGEEEGLLPGGPDPLPDA